MKKNSQADWIIIQDEIKGKFGFGKRELDTLIKEAERATEPESTRPLYEKEGCYYRTKKIDGGTVAEKISNFILVINEIMTMPNGEEVVSADLKLDGSYVSRNINISNRELLSKSSMQSALQKTGTKWLGNETDIQNLRDYIQHKKVPNENVKIKMHIFYNIKVHNYYISFSIYISCL